jgi:hypothetical protein
MPDCWHWVLANPEPLPFQPCQGRLGLFEFEYLGTAPQLAFAFAPIPACAGLQ